MTNSTLPAGCLNDRPSELELERKLKRPRIRLHVGDSAELASEPVHRVRAAAGIGRQAPTRIRQRQVLMIEDIEGIYSKLEELRFRDAELLVQACVRAPERRPAGVGQQVSSRAEPV